MASNRSSPQTVESSSISAQTPQTLGSSSDPRTATTISDHSEPQYQAVVVEEISEYHGSVISEAQTIEHIESSSDDLQVLELEVEMASAACREAEAKERLAKAKARRSRTGSSRTSISSAHFGSLPQTDPVNVPAAVSDLHAVPPTQEVTGRESSGQPMITPTVPPELRQPELPVRQGKPGWLEWFERHAPIPGAARQPMTATETPTEPVPNQFLCVRRG